MFLPEDTPEWIHEFLKTTPHGGWIHPIPLTDSHPIVDEEWACYHCLEPLRDGDVAIIMPFANEEGESWIGYHRKCALTILGLETLDEAVPSPNREVPGE